MAPASAAKNTWGKVLGCQFATQQATGYQQPEAHTNKALGPEEQCAAVATSCLHNIAVKYTGKDDPVVLVQTQMDFLATGESRIPLPLGLSQLTEDPIRQRTTLP